MSVELKITRNSVMLFQICKMQLLVYEIPYINSPALGLIS
jgi:hypothetical protein